jgi:predicted Zn finger-like uncharacterized protein
MSIVFYCPSCGARFEVDDALAGRQAKCRRCGERMTIPAARQPVTVAARSAAGEFRLTPETAAMPPAPVAPPARPAVPSWIDAVTSRVALAPLVEERWPGEKVAAAPAVRPSPLDDLGDSKPYQLASLSRVALPQAGRSERVSGVKVLWRRELGGLQRILRWLNDAAYLISVPFIIMVLVGGIFKNRSLALVGAAAVVLLNLSRLVTGLFNLVIIPFKDSILRGVLFLIPPFTFLDLYVHRRQLRKPLRRVLEPAVTIGLVAVTFALLPSLRGGGSDQAGITQRVISSAEDVKAELEQARNLDLQSLGTKAKRALEEFSPTAGFGGENPAPEAGSAPPGLPKRPPNRSNRSR